MKITGLYPKPTELEALETELRNLHFINSSALDEIFTLIDFRL